VPIRTLPVRLSLGSETPTTAVVNIADWTLFERVKRGTIAMTFCWCGAAIVLPIPMVHLVVPPVLILLGPVLFMWRLLTHSSFKEVVGRCPRCKEERTMSMGGRVQSETNVFCDGCGNQLTLRLEQPS